MLEKEIERALVKRVKEKGGLALKFVSPGTAGVPDRLILFPIAHMGFVELKAPGKKMRPIQLRRKFQLEKIGFRVYRIDRIWLPQYCNSAGRTSHTPDPYNR